MPDDLQTSIVIPAFNEQDRLPATLDALAAELGSLFGVTVREVIVVDDGSADSTTKVASSFSEKLPHLRVITTPANRGKGHAVRTGIAAASSDWVLVADADMSTPWGEVSGLAEPAVRDRADIAIGSRDLPESDISIRQSFMREYLGRTFNVLIRLLTRLPFRDTQCGFKLVRHAAVEPFLDALRVDRFAWDVEFLILARDHGLKTVEVPVRWEHKDASRVHPIIDGFDMARAVITMQLRRLFSRP